MTVPPDWFRISEPAEWCGPGVLPMPPPEHRRPMPLVWFLRGVLDEHGYPAAVCTPDEFARWLDSWGPPP